MTRVWTNWKRSKFNSLISWSLIAFAFEPFIQKGANLIHISTNQQQRIQGSKMVGHTSKDTTLNIDHNTVATSYIQNVSMTHLFHKFHPPNPLDIYIWSHHLQQARKFRYSCMEHRHCTPSSWYYTKYLHKTIR